MVGRMLMSTAILTLAAASTHAQESLGKVPWEKDARRAMEKDRDTGVPMMLYFWSRG